MTRYLIPVLICAGLLLATASVYATDAGPAPAAAVDEAPSGVDLSPAEGIGTSPSDKSTPELGIATVTALKTGAYWVAAGLIVILLVRLTRGYVARALRGLFGGNVGGLVYAGLMAFLVAMGDALGSGEPISWALALTAGKLAVGAVLGYHALTSKPALGGTVAAKLEP